MRKPNFNFFNISPKSQSIGYLRSIRHQDKKILTYGEWSLSFLFQINLTGYLRNSNINSSKITIFRNIKTKCIYLPTKVRKSAIFSMNLQFLKSLMENRISILMINLFMQLYTWTFNSEGLDWMFFEKIRTGQLKFFGFDKSLHSSENAITSHSV